jgi:ParB/RepB/Spo0J family partition protein
VRRNKKAPTVRSNWGPEKPEQPEAAPLDNNENDDPQYASVDDDDDEELFSSISTLEAAQEQLARRIEELKDGSKADRRVATLLSKCHKGKRCNLPECAVCERRKLIAYRVVPNSIVTSVGSLFQRTDLKIDAIEVVAKRRRALNEAKVQAIAASMKLIGLQTPITVQSFKRKVILVAGWHRLEAAKRLSWDSIPCVVLTGELETRFWQLAENYYRAESTALERAEATEELRLLIKQMPLEEERLAPRGGRQPHDMGIKKAARVLGITREEVRRAMAIAGISARAKKRASELGLDDNQQVLLEIAKQAAPEGQVSAIEEIVARKRAESARRASEPAVDKKAVKEINTLHAEIREGGAKLAANRNRLRLIEDKLAVQGELPSVTATDEQKPTSLPLSPEDEAQVAALIKALDWNPKLKAKLANASPAVLDRVIAIIRSEQAHQ